MKKIILCSFFLLLAVSSFTQELRFGFTASPTFSFSNIDSSNVNPSFGEDSGTKLGINYGVLVDYDFNGDERYFLNSGLMLHHTGFIFDKNISGVAGNDLEEYQVNANYIEIPILLKLKTNEIGYLSYFGQFGLNNGIKVGEKFKEPESATEDDLINNFNMGLNIGAGAEYEIAGETTAVGGLYYVNGFTNSVDNSLGTLKQNQLGIRLGVYF